MLAIYAGDGAARQLILWHGLSVTPGRPPARPGLRALGTGAVRPALPLPGCRLISACLLAMGWVVRSARSVQLRRNRAPYLAEGVRVFDATSGRRAAALPGADGRWADVISSASSCQRGTHSAGACRPTHSMAAPVGRWYQHRRT